MSSMMAWADLLTIWYVKSLTRFPSTTYRPSAVALISISMCLNNSLSLWWVPAFPNVKPRPFSDLSSFTSSKACSKVSGFKSMSASLATKAYLAMYSSRYRPTKPVFCTVRWFYANMLSLANSCAAESIWSICSSFKSLNSGLSAKTSLIAFFMILPFLMRDCSVAKTYNYVPLRLFMWSMDS